MTTENTSAAGVTTSNAIQGKINVTRIVTHKKLHTDEAFGIWALKKFGGERFNGLDSAKVFFLSDSPTQNDEFYDKNGFLPVGVGGGRFDDHVCGIERESATSLVFKFLSITDRAASRVAEEIHRCDKDAGVSNTQLAEVAKMVNRTMENAERCLITWLNIAFDALYDQFTMSYAEVPGEASVTAYFDGAVKVGRIKDQNAREAIRKKLLKSEEITKKFLTGDDRLWANTEIDFIVRIMQRIGKSHDDIHEWLRFFFEWMEVDHVRFMEAVEMCKNTSNQFTVPARLDGRNVNLRACYLSTDNPHSLRASNYCRNQITILKNTKGQVQIFLNAKLNLNLDMVVYFLRWYELPTQEKKRASWNLLTVEKSLNQVPKWYYNREAKQFLNGSSSYPGVEPTQIHIDTINQVIYHSFRKDLSYGYAEHLGLRRKQKRPTEYKKDEGSDTASQTAALISLQDEFEEVEEGVQTEAPEIMPETEQVEGETV